MRDITLGDTFYHFFTTRQFSTGEPFTLEGTPALSVLEENNATPITSGVSLSVDRASVVGLNQATIVATGGNGFEAGKSYAIYISTGTVDSVSVVGEVVGEFTIQASAAAVDLANGTDGLGAIKAETAAIVADTNELQTDWANGGRLDNILDARASQASVDAIGTDVDAILVDTGTDIPASLAAIAAFIDTEVAAILAAVDTEVAAILADTNELQTDWTNGGRLDLLVDAIKAKTDSLTFTVAGQVDANMQSVNDVALEGDGGATPWGPA